jgi:RimJ/RimL family protein N-acetyltransferase
VKTALQRDLERAAERKAAPLPEVIETARLTIQRGTLADLEASYDMALEAAATLPPWMPWAHPTVTLESMRAYYEKLEREWNDRVLLDFQVSERATGRLLGKVGLHHIDWMLPRFEIGYWLRPSATGKGYCVEAVNGLVDYAVQHLHPVRIEIRMATENAASRAVAERAGFICEGVMRNGTWAPPTSDHQPRVRDAYLFAKVF